MARIKKTGSVVALILGIASLLCIIGGVAGNYQATQDRIDYLEKSFGDQDHKIETMENQWNSVSKDIAVIKAILTRIEQSLDKITSKP